MEEAFELPANVEALVVGDAIGGEEPYSRANGNVAVRCTLPWHCASVSRLTQSPLLCLEPLRFQTRVDAIR